MSNLSSRLLVLAGRFFNSRPVRAIEALNMKLVVAAVKAVCGGDGTNVEGFFKAVDEENDRVIASWLTGHPVGPAQPGAILDLARWAVGISTDASIATLRRVARFEALIGLPPSAAKVAEAAAEIFRVAGMLEALLPLGVMASQPVDFSKLDWRKAARSRLKTDEEMAAEAALRPSDEALLAAVKATYSQCPGAHVKELRRMPVRQQAMFVAQMSAGVSWDDAARTASCSGDAPVGGPAGWWIRGVHFAHETREALECEAFHARFNQLSFDLDEHAN